MAFNSQFSVKINRYRKRAGLPPIKDFLNDISVSNLMNFVSVSPSLYTIPNKEADSIQVIGYLGNHRSITSFSIPKDLTDFLNTKQLVVFVTFGSINNLDPDPSGTIDLILMALKLAGVKGILQYNWDDYSTNLEKDIVYRIKRIPHEVIFPCCALIIHHGGAGTTQAAASSGKPSIVVSHGIDQSYNGGLLKRQGLCSVIINRHNLTSKLLANAILSTIKDTNLRNNAEKFALRMRNENAAERALELISRIINKEKEV